MTKTNVLRLWIVVFYSEAERLGAPSYRFKHVIATDENNATQKFKKWMKQPNESIEDFDSRRLCSELKVAYVREVDIKELVLEVE